MTSDPANYIPKSIRHDELSVLTVRLLRDGERPLPTEEEIDDYEFVDPGLDAAIRRHLEPYFGRAPSTFHDTQGTFAIDVAMSEPTDSRPWGACFTIGASFRPMPPAGPASRGASPHVELFLRLPEKAFRYWDDVVLEPFESPFDAVIDALGELAKLPHEAGVGYASPQVVVMPDFEPMVEGLPFAGVLLRDAMAVDVRMRVLPMRLPKRGSVSFLSVTFLHASEIRALMGDRLGTIIRLVEKEVFDDFDPGRRPVV